MIDNNKLREERDEAIKMLAEWCVAVDTRGSDWDSWDEHYKNAAWRPCLNRSLIDAAVLYIKDTEREKKMADKSERESYDD